MTAKKKHAYVVEWKQMLTGGTPQEAAQAAYDSLQRPSNSTLFRVTKVVEREEDYEDPEDVDLADEFEMSFHNLTKPCATDEEVEKLSYEGKIQVNVAVDLARVISCDGETFLDLLEARILGYDRDTRWALENVFYRVVGTNADRNIVIAVSADLVDMEQEEESTDGKDAKETPDKGSEESSSEPEPDPDRTNQGEA